jgi:acetyl-CoA carboxylase beta subunit
MNETVASIQITEVHSKLEKVATQREHLNFVTVITQPNIGKVSSLKVAGYTYVRT